MRDALSGLYLCVWVKSCLFGLETGSWYDQWEKKPSFCATSVLQHSAESESTQNSEWYFISSEHTALCSTPFSAHGSGPSSSSLGVFCFPRVASILHLVVNIPQTLSWLFLLWHQHTNLLQSLLHSARCCTSEGLEHHHFCGLPGLLLLLSCQLTHSLLSHSLLRNVCWDGFIFSFFLPG